MAAKNYTVTGQGLDWAQALLQHPVEEGKSYELDLSKEQETAVIAAGWLVEDKGGKK